MTTPAAAVAAPTASAMNLSRTQLLRAVRTWSAPNSPTATARLTHAPREKLSRIAKPTTPSTPSGSSDLRSGAPESRLRA